METQNLLNLIAGFDWISPVAAIIQDKLEGQVSHFGVQAIGFDRNDIYSLLYKHGVRSWGYVYNVAGDLIMFSVARNQFKWAKYILIREGVPVLYENPT